METNLIIGIDVSKDDLDFAEKSSLLPVNTFSSEGKLENKIPAIIKFLSRYNVATVRIVLEPTGTYSDKLQSVLTQMGFQYHYVNPKQSHHYALSKGIINKNDVQAARMLAEMGQVLDLPIYQPPTRDNQVRKQLMKAIVNLQKEQRRYANKLHALAQLAEPTKILETTFKNMIVALTKELEILEQQLSGLKDTEFNEKKKLALTVCGIGEKTANWLLTLTNGFNYFENAKQVIKFLGLAPGSHRSGSSVNKKSGINKSCHGKIRGSLFMAAKSAIRFNPSCKALYERLRNKGKNYYQAIVAVMCKLVKQTFAVVKSGKKYDKKYHLKFQK